MTIYFYSTIDKYGDFSNFSKHGFELDGKYWLTVEHYFQAQKFVGTEYKEKIRRSETAKKAKTLGMNRSIPIRTDWDQVKDEIMKKAVRRKFETHKELVELLLCTNKEEIIESSPYDYYWGCGGDGSGHNKLGIILMEIRKEYSGK